MRISAGTLQRAIDDLAARVSRIEAEIAGARAVDAMVPIETPADADRAFALLYAEPVGEA